MIKSEKRSPKKQEGKLKPIVYKENPKLKRAKELSPDMVAQGLRKWLIDEKEGKGKRR